MPERAVVPHGASLTRRQIRAAERTPAATGTTPAVRVPRWLPRAAVLGVLGAATVVAPLTALASRGEEPAAPNPAPVVETVSHNALDLLDAAATRTEIGSVGATAAIMADVGAPGRALVQTSRSIDRDAAVCSVVGDAGANGARAALVGTSVVTPLSAGTYDHSSGYGDRVHPITGAWSKHEGLDYAAPLGTPIHAVADGTVVHAGDGIDGRSSMLVIVQHEIDGATYFSWYVHMYPEGVFVAQGQRVRAGEVIGEVGNNGNSTGPHLHLEIHLDTAGTTMDPQAFLDQHDAVQLTPETCA